MFYIQYLTSKTILIPDPQHIAFAKYIAWCNWHSFRIGMLDLVYLSDLRMLKVRELYWQTTASGLCERRSWSEPAFETRRTNSGQYTCRVRVNNREYNSDTSYSSENLAREKAAESAYLLCYNFSMNDGMLPGGRHCHAGVVQGLPVAIGTGRRQSRHQQEQYTGASAYPDAFSRNSSRSPETSGSSNDREALSHAASRKSSMSSYGSEHAAPICNCRRGYVMQHSRCGHCLREAGYQYTLDRQ